MKEIKIAIATSAVIIISIAIIYSGKGTVIALIKGGKFVAPEASNITYQYCFVKGKTLY